MPELRFDPLRSEWVRLCPLSDNGTTPSLPRLLPSRPERAWRRIRGTARQHSRSWCSRIAFPRWARPAQADVPSSVGRQAARVIVYTPGARPDACAPNALFGRPSSSKSGPTATGARLRARGRIRVIIREQRRRGGGHAPPPAWPGSMRCPSCRRCARRDRRPRAATSAREGECLHWQSCGGVRRARCWRAGLDGGICPGRPRAL